MLNILKSISLLVLLFSAAVSAAAADGTKFTPPGEDDIPVGPFGESVLYGKKLLTETGSVLKKNSGNGLNCTSCHLAGGRTPYAAPWVGLWGVFPEYRARSGRVISLQDRVNDCFERSLNGRALHPASREMNAILSYMAWLSKGVPTGVSVEGRGFQTIKFEKKPDPLVGKQLFQAKCASCHGMDGQGRKGAGGEYLYPALWGPKSFNIAAGMARLNTAAAFIKANMPKGLEGSLSKQEAFDIAEYFIHQARPDFKGKNQDWPKGDRPVDARY